MKKSRTIPGSRALIGKLLRTTLLKHHTCLIIHKRTLTKTMLITKSGKTQKLSKRTKFISKIPQLNKCSKATTLIRIINLLLQILNLLLPAIMKTKPRDKWASLILHMGTETMLEPNTSAKLIYYLQIISKGLRINRYSRCKSIDNFK